MASYNILFIASEEMVSRGDNQMGWLEFESKFDYGYYSDFGWIGFRVVWFLDPKISNRFRSDSDIYIGLTHVVQFLKKYSN